MYLFIAIYIAMRSVISIFYDYSIFFGFSPLEFSGVFFPVILFLWSIYNLFFRGFFDEITNIFYTMFVVYVFFILLVKVLGGSDLRFNASLYFRILNGYTAFVLFPLIFNTYDKVKLLLYAYLFSVLFPVLQAVAQVLISPTFLGMTTSFSRGHTDSNLLMYYGYYHKYDGYAWASLLGLMLMLYFLPLVKGKKIKYIYIGISIFWFMAFLTLSRTLILCAAFVSFSLFAYLKKSMFTISVIVVMFFLLSNFTLSRIDQLYLRSESEISVLYGTREIDAGFHGRFSLWLHAFELYNDTPVFKQLFGTNIHVGPHGDYVNWFLYFGVIGFLFYLALFLVIFFRVTYFLFRTKKMYNAYGCHFSLFCFGYMTFIGLFVWFISSVIHNPTHYPDYSYFFLGNSGIFIFYAKLYEKNYYHRPHSSSIHGPQHCHKDYSKVQAVI